MTYFNQKNRKQKPLSWLKGKHLRIVSLLIDALPPPDTRLTGFVCRLHWSSVPSQSCVTHHPALSVSRSRSVQPCSQHDLLALMSAQHCWSSHPSPDLQCLCLDCAGSHSCCWLSELHVCSWMSRLFYPPGPFPASLSQTIWYAWRRIWRYKCYGDSVTRNNFLYFAITFACSLCSQIRADVLSNFFLAVNEKSGVCHASFPTLMITTRPIDVFFLSPKISLLAFASSGELLYVASLIHTKSLHANVMHIYVFTLKWTF